MIHLYIYFFAHLDFPRRVFLIGMLPLKYLFRIPGFHQCLIHDFQGLYGPFIKLEKGREWGQRKEDMDIGRLLMGQAREWHIHLFSHSSVENLSRTVRELGKVVSVCPKSWESASSLCQYWWNSFVLRNSQLISVLNWVRTKPNFLIGFNSNEFI